VTTSSGPREGSSPLESSATRGRRTPITTSMKAAPMCANWTRCSGRTATLAPASSSRNGAPGTGTTIASAGRCTPRARLKRNSDAARAAPVVKALEDLDQTLSAIENEIYQVKLQSSQDPLNFPIKLNNKIAALQGVVESGDARPTEQAYSVFRTLSTRLDDQLAKLDAAVKTRMPPVNQQLQRQKLDPLKAEPLKPEPPKTGSP